MVFYKGVLQLFVVLVSFCLISVIHSSAIVENFRNTVIT